MHAGRENWVKNRIFIKKLSTYSDSCNCMINWATFGRDCMVKIMLIT